MDIKVNAKSAYILKSKMLSMFAPFSKLSEAEAKVYGLMVYYATQGRSIDDKKIMNDLLKDTGSSRQVLYNVKTKLRKKGFIDQDGLVESLYKLISRNEFKFNFIINGERS